MKPNPAKRAVIANQTGPPPCLYLKAFHSSERTECHTKKLAKAHPALGMALGHIGRLDGRFKVPKCRECPEDMQDVSYLSLKGAHPEFCRRQRAVEVVGMESPPKDTSLLCDVLRRNYATVRWVLCEYGQLPDAVR